MRVRVALLDVMDIVGRHQLEPHVGGPRDELPVDLRLLGDPVVVQFEVVILRSKRLLEPVDLITRFVRFVS